MISVAGAFRSSDIIINEVVDIKPFPVDLNPGMIRGITSGTPFWGSSLQFFNGNPRYFECINMNLARGYSSKDIKILSGCLATLKVLESDVIK